GESGRSRNARARIEIRELLATGEIEHVELAVARAHIDTAAGDDRRRVDTSARGERPDGLARSRVERVDELVASTENDSSVADCGRRIEGKLAILRCISPDAPLALEIEGEHLVVERPEVGAVAVDEWRGSGVGAGFDLIDLLAVSHAD